MLDRVMYIQQITKLLFAVLLLASIQSVFAEEDKTKGGKKVWNSWVDSDPLDAKSAVGANVFAAESMDAYLSVYCRRDRTILYVSFGDNVSFAEETMVSLRVDRHRIKRYMMDNSPASDDGLFLADEEAQNFLNNKYLLLGKQLLIRAENEVDGEYIDLLFNIDGIEEILEPVSVACDWKLNKIKRKA